MGKLGIFIGRADKLLTGGVDILAADLEEVPCAAKLHHPIQLLGGVTGGHEGNSVEAVFLQHVEDLVKVIVLKLLGLLVAGDRVAHVTKISIGGDAAVAVYHIGKVAHRGKLGGSGDVDLLHQIALQGTENIVLIKIGGLVTVQNIFLVLAGAEITCSDFAPIYCKQAKNLYIYLEKDTTNKITDGNNYVLAEGTDEPDAAIFSHDDLFIMGEGTLIVDANYNDGITGKDDVNIESGKIVVDAVNHGIKGKDSLEIKGGNIEITANGDGLKSTQDQDATLGFVEIKDGATVKITAGDEGIQAFTNVIIKGGNITIDSIDAAIKAEQVIEFKGGTIEINTYDSPFSATKIEKTPEVSVTVNGSKYEFN